MNYIHNISQHAQDYWKDVPQNAGLQMAYSFAGTFIICSILRNNTRSGMIAGALSAFAVAIHALVTPIFKKIIGNRQHLTWCEEMCRSFIAVITVGLAAAAFGDRSVIKGLFTYAVLYGLLTCIRDEDRRNINNAGWFGIFPDYTPI